MKIEYTLDEFFAGQAHSRRIYDALMTPLSALGPMQVKVTKSQVALRRKKVFAWVWIPGKYLRGKTAPLVLTICLPARDPSPRWKEIVEPAKGRFIHHLELFATSDIDDEVLGWLRAAWDTAG